LYAHDQARIQVDGNHVIADKQFSVGRDHIDGVGTTMDVNGRLTVGNAGAAGGWYQEDRYIDKKFDANYNGNLQGYENLPNEHFFAKDPTALGQRWLDNIDRTLEYLDRGLDNLGNPTNAKDGTTTGNSPGLAITAGAVVQSGEGMVGNTSTANGYVLIDDKRVQGDDPNTSDEYRTRWIVKNGAPFGADGHLTIGGAGNGMVRVINGSLLQSESTTIAQKDGGRGYLYVVGGNEVPAAERNDALTGASTTWRPSEWISKGPTILGEQTGDERGTIRIEEGAHGVTQGLYVGLARESQGEISVSGFSYSKDAPDDFNSTSTRSLLEIYKDTSGYAGSKPAGSSTLSVSDYGYLWMHEGSELRLNGVGIISNGAILHLSEDRVKILGEYNTDPAGIFTRDVVHQPGRIDMIEEMRKNGSSAYAEGHDRSALLDAMKSKITIVNARIEGDGIVTGEDGVFITADEKHNPTGVPTEVDPGQRYDWKNHDEYEGYYGTLVFGDQLRQTGNVITNFDVNSGYYEGMGGTGKDAENNPAPLGPNQDLIVVKRGDSSTSQSDVLAQLSGTLSVHARLTDYYE
jgi:hypothetical protein